MNLSEPTSEDYPIVELFRRRIMEKLKPEDLLNLYKHVPVIGGVLQLKHLSKLSLDEINGIYCLACDKENASGSVMYQSIDGTNFKGDTSTMVMKFSKDLNIKMYNKKIDVDCPENLPLIHAYLIKQGYDIFGLIPRRLNQISC